MKRILLFWLSFLTVTGLEASHIVGGEFELLHIKDFRYQLNLVLYFDDINGLPGAQDASIVAHIFRKRDHVFLRNVTLSLQTRERVPFFNPDCTPSLQDQIRTDRIFYSTQITLSPDQFDDPEGYYVSWERCCRNYTIQNVFSDDPDIPGGISSGQTFYLEFPPVVKDGEPFVNSSPILFPPLSDPGCIDQFYWVGFQGSDPDGDSLVYTMITPLSTHETNVAIPTQTRPAPYPEVTWRSGFSDDNFVNGNPDLRITTDGFISVRPTAVGLFVFAIQCREYRDGVQIGEVRRDYQMLVIDCPVSDPPEIKARPKNSSDFYVEGDTLFYQVADDQKCIDIIVDDPDPGERVFIRAKPVNFEGEISEILPPISAGNIGPNGEPVSFEVCFGDCPFLRDEPFLIDVVAYDDSCPLPLTDSVRLTVVIEAPPNRKPDILTTRGADFGDFLTHTVTEQAGGVYTFDFIVRDPDGDSVFVDFVPEGFNLEDFGMSYSIINDGFEEDLVRFTWNYDCTQPNISFDGKTNFELTILAEDKDQCQYADPDELEVNLNIILPPNTEPEVFLAGNRLTDYYFLEFEVDELVRLNIQADDQDDDRISLLGFGTDFNFSDYNIDFIPIEARGLPGANTTFTWNLICETFDLAVRDSFRIMFLVEDFDRCQITNRDTLTVDIKVVPDVNSDPFLSIRELFGTEIIEDRLKATIGDTINLSLQGTDFEEDSIFLELLNIEPLDPETYSFTPVGGVRNVSSSFEWVPQCELLPPGESSMTYTFEFILRDEHCLDPKNDTVSVDIEINDVLSLEEEFLPANVFTPNGDGCNDFFAMEGEYATCNGGQALIKGLPFDNCRNSFQSIRIYNRWGKQVFISNQRDFRWYGDGESAGVYYYYLQYTQRDYRGTVSVLY